MKRWSAFVNSTRIERLPLAWCAGFRLRCGARKNYHIRRETNNMAWIFFTAFIVVAVVGALVWNQAEDEMRENEKRIENMKAEVKMYQVRRERQND